MGTFVIEDWRTPFAGDGGFIRVEGLSFDDPSKAHEKLEELIAAGELSERAVVSTYPKHQMEEVGDDRRTTDEAIAGEQFFAGSD